MDEYEIVPHGTVTVKIAQIFSQTLIIETTEDALDVMGNVYYQGFDKMVLHQRNITPNFFDLKTQLAGDILQKFSNYRIQLAIVGDFKNITSGALKDFIYESKKNRNVFFVSTLQEAVEHLS